ncbi:MAG TPA: ABC transporter permease, partial [Gemmatirosa sp.]|nr:ABC transporter permease [Gemmatirosa sp.]
EELESFLAERRESLVARGMTPAAAHAEALRRLGGRSLDEVRERLHRSAERREDRMRLREGWDRVAQDLRIAARGLRRAPALVVTVVLSLALGIGANAAIFSLFDQLLLRPLPVPRPEQLVKLVTAGYRPADSFACGTVGECDEAFSYPMVRDLERARTGLAGVAAHTPIDVNVAHAGRTEHGRGALVSGAYFPVLALRPALGRLLGPADDRTLGAHPVVVLSHGYWRSRLGGDPGVLNRTLVVNGVPLTIVGVAPRGFEGTTLGVRPTVFVPLAMAGPVAKGRAGMDGFDTSRRIYWLYLFGRLQPGVTVERARATLNAAYRSVVRNVELPLTTGATAVELARFARADLALEPASRGQSALAGRVRTPLVLLFGVAGVVLLIACANVASLLLARGAARSMEVAVRVSLGAGRGRVVAQLLTEALALAALGGAAGLLVAHGTLAAATSILPPDAAGAFEPGLRWPVVGFAAAVTTATGIVFGLLPALHSTRPDLVSTIRASAGQIAGVRGAARARTALVAAQIALSMVLLVGAGLFLKSLRNVARADLGLAASRLATFTIEPELSGHAPERRKALFRRVDDALAAMPGVTGVSAARVPILTGGSWTTDAYVEGRRIDPAAAGGIRINLVGPQFFRTVGIPLLAGREFTPEDREGTPGVAVVNEAFLRKYRLGRDVVGKRIGVWGDQDLSLRVVGIVGDAKYDQVKSEMAPGVYTPLLQDPRLGSVTYYVRASGDPARVLRHVPGVMARVDPDVPVQDLKTLPQQVRENVAVDRMIGALSTAFAAVATLLAAVGLYGVLAYTVAQRTREIGVRMAIGADARRVRGLVLGQVARLVLAGGVVGLLGALALGRAAQSLLFGLRGHDPTAVAGAAAVLALVALAAGYLPARRASHIDPMQALRGD